jgi:hypothetical protein
MARTTATTVTLPINEHTAHIVLEVLLNSFRERWDPGDDRMPHDNAGLEDLAFDCHALAGYAEALASMELRKEYEESKRHRRDAKAAATDTPTA